jgi:DNA-binding NtrC family response regulator
VQILKAGIGQAPNRVLLVEDDPAVTSLVKMVLHSVNPETEFESCTSAESAQALIQSQRKFALIVCDQNLDGKATGLDLWRFCRDAQLKTPFVMMSSIHPGKFFDLVGREEVSPYFLAKPLPKERCRDLLSWFIPSQVVARGTIKVA